MKEIKPKGRSNLLSNIKLTSGRARIKEENLKVDLNLNTLLKNFKTFSDSFGIKYGDINNANKVHDKFIYNK